MRAEIEASPELLGSHPRDATEIGRLLARARVQAGLLGTMEQAREVDALAVAWRAGVEVDEIIERVEALARQWRPRDA